MVRGSRYEVHGVRGEDAVPYPAGMLYQGLIQIPHHIVHDALPQRGAIAKAYTHTYNIDTYIHTHIHTLE